MLGARDYLDPWVLGWWVQRVRLDVAKRRAGCLL